MIHSPRFTAILDACVLYPAPVRDLLLNLADLDLYTPKWTDRIHNEWKRSLLNKRGDLTEEQLDRAVHEMNKAFPDANVIGYESLIVSFHLPDPDDCHVLAAAVRCRADVIVTSNVKHFPKECLREFDIEAQHPDLFVSNIIDLNPKKSTLAFHQQVATLKNPPMTEAEVLRSLKNAGLVLTSEKLGAPKGFSTSSGQQPSADD